MILDTAIEWMLRRRAIRDARQRQKDLPRRRRDLFERALSTWEAARDTHEPSGPLVHAPAHAMTLELCRQSVHWALCFRESAREGDGGEDAGAVSLSTLWARCDPDLLLRSAGNASTLEVMERVLARASFVDLAELGEREQRELVPRVLAFSRTLIALLDAPDNALRAARSARTQRLAALLVIVLVALVGLIAFGGSNEERLDLARERAWKSSSSMGGCRSPQQSCSESPLYFFHTAEEDDPWLEIDLGAKQFVSAVRLLNRNDCCPDRAVPLVVELSDDREKWREVARRTESFINLRLDFRQESARYVRVRALKKTWLHLRAVRVLP
jgi:hypothetical protein